MRLSRSPGRALLIACAMSVAACHDESPAPRPVVPFDAQQALGKITPLTAVFDQEIVASFDVTLSYTEVYFNSGLFASADFVPQIRGFDARLTRALVPATRLSANGVPSNLRGKTFTYDINNSIY